MTSSPGKRHVVRAGAAPADDARLPAYKGAILTQGQLRLDLYVAASEALQSGAIVFTPGVRVEPFAWAGLLKGGDASVAVDRCPAVAADPFVVDTERAEVVGALAGALGCALASLSTSASAVFSAGAA